MPSENMINRKWEESMGLQADRVPPLRLDLLSVEVIKEGPAPVLCFSLSCLDLAGRHNARDHFSVLSYMYPGVFYSSNCKEINSVCV